MFLPDYMAQQPDRQYSDTRRRENPKFQISSIRFLLPTKSFLQSNAEFLATLMELIIPGEKY
jgi:hypothetical protein